MQHRTPRPQLASRRKGNDRVSENVAEAYPVALPDIEKKLVLTYDNSVMTDGVGAQLQRIYGIYAISRLLGATYLHSPLSRVDYQGLAALERNLADPGFHHAFNELFRIESDILPSSEFYEVNLQEISIDTVISLLPCTTDMRQAGGRHSCGSCSRTGSPIAFPTATRCAREFPLSRQLLEKVAFCALPSMCDGESKSY